MSQWRFSSKHFFCSPSRYDAERLLLGMNCMPPDVGYRLVDKPLVLYGAGNLGKLAYAYFEHLGKDIMVVVDANAKRFVEDAFWYRVNVLYSRNVPISVKKNSLLAICIANFPYVPVAKDLYDQEWSQVVPFYDIAEGYTYEHPLSNGWFAGSLTTTDIAAITKVLVGWEDDISRAHHLQFIAWRLLREEWVFDGAPVSTEDRFFIPEVLAMLTSDECFADVGAYHGSVTLRFLRATQGHFKRIWAIEPDSDSLQQLNAAFLTLDTTIQKRIQVIQAAVGCVNESRRFYDGLGYASQLSELGQQCIEVKTLDQLNLFPSYIKLHLEGAELDALKGAEHTIRRCRPIIAVTSYHNRDGLWAIPKWLMDNLHDYRFLMRLHSWCGTGAVVYALPNERKT